MLLAPRALYPVHTFAGEGAWLPVSVAELKTHIGLPPEDTSRDVELTAFIVAAMRAVEAFASIRVRRVTVTAAMNLTHERFALCIRPFASMTRIDIVADGTGEITTVPTATYHVQPTGQHAARVVLGADAEWPDIAVRDDAVRAVYEAGWADVASVPADVKLAILMTAAKLDANRGDCGCDDGGGGTVYAMKNSRPSALPETAAMLLQPYLYMGLVIA
ncbi:MAG: hypothetical protein NW216_07560 [Hyphomicrobium sp.]|nr:hypothetical protein [Hyphomicrobium sp.]